MRGLMARCGFGGFERRATAVQVEKYLDLRQQDEFVDRFGDVVDRADFITVETIQIILVSGGHENDRCTVALAAFGQQRGHFKAVHFRHLHIEQDQRELMVERSEEHTSELQSLMRISYAVFCLKKKTKK